MKTLVLANQKGGVGKSAVATLAAQYLAREGKRVLAIDLDHQANFTEALTRSGRCTIAATTSDHLLTTSSPPAIPAGNFVLVPSGPALLTLERQHALHNAFAQALRAFLAHIAPRFDTCVVDTNPNPDIRLIAALASCDAVLSPVQLNQEALDGVTFLLTHQRVGLLKIKAVLNPKLHFLGLLPTMVEATSFQRANFTQVALRYAKLLLHLPDGHTACLPKRSVVAESQASGELIWEMKKTAARDAWKEFEPVLACITQALFAGPPAVEAKPQPTEQPA
jgi:chromosome partitioning protein